MFAGILIMCAGMCIGILDNYDLGPLYAYECAFALYIAYYFIPVCSALPICYIQRYLSREATSRLLVFRSDQKRYIAGTVISTILAGFLVVAVASLLFAGISFLLCWPEGVTTAIPAGGAATLEESEGLVEYVKAGYLDLMLYEDTGLLRTFPILGEHHALMFAVNIFLNSLQGSMYSVAALGCIAFTHNQYIAVAFPFLLNRVLLFLASETHSFWLNPGQLSLDGVMSETIGGGLVFAFSYWAIVTLLFGGIWTIREMRRTRRG